MSQDKRSFSYFDVIRTFFYFLEGAKGKFIFLNIVFVICSLFAAVTPYLLGYYVDYLIAGQNLEQFWAIPLLSAVLLTTVGVVRTTTKNTLKRMKFDVGQSARVRGLERLLLLPLSAHQQELSGNKVQRIQSGASALQEWVHLATNHIYPVATNFVGPVIAFVFIQPMYVLFFVVYLIIYFVIELFYKKRSVELQQEIQAYKEKMSGSITEGISNTLAIKALGAQKNMHAQYSHYEEHMKELRYREVWLTQTKWSIFQVLHGVGSFLFLYSVGAQVIGGALSAGMVFTFFAYFRSIQQAANDSSETISTMIERRAELERMMPIFWETEGMVHGSEPFPKRWSKILFDKVSFGYDERILFNSFSTMIDRNEIVGIRGASGSGKSTLVKLMLGLYTPEKGAVRIGSTNVADILHDELLAKIGLVLQEPELFSLSIKDNITMFGSVNEQRLVEVAKLAGLERLISELPQGMDTVIGERGYALSGGQRQRVGIARALYKDAPILVMDEATSALDPETEAMVMNKIIDEYKGKKTIIIVAHRETTLSFADRIISLR